MSELEERLNQLMNSPEDMDRIASMASRLMGQIAPEEKSPAPDSGGDILALASRVMKGMSSGSQKALLAGMAPYLAENRKNRLERALRLASAARAATAALREMGDGHGL